jgi:hypothetical protein
LAETTLLIMLLFAAPVLAADCDAGPIHVAQPWARATE